MGLHSKEVAFAPFHPVTPVSNPGSAKILSSLLLSSTLRFLVEIRFVERQLVERSWTVEVKIEPI